MPEDQVELDHPFLRQLATGMHPEALDAAMDALSELLEAVARTDRKGQLTVKVAVEPHKNIPSAVVVIPDVVGKPPRVAARGRLAYIDRDGGLSLRDPRQTSLDVDVDAVTPLRPRKDA